MRFKNTLILFIVFLGLGAYVYFAEYRGRDARQQQEEAAKRVFQFDEKDVTELSLVYPDQTLAAVKKDGQGWEITQPAGIEADSDEWDRLASNLSRVERGETVTTEAKDLAPFGLDKPAISVTAKLKDGRTVSMLFGSENPKKSFNYAKLPDKPDVFLSGTSWNSMFKKSLTDLRNKKVLVFETDSIDAVRIVDEKGAEMSFARSGMDWTLKKPLDTRADGTEVSSLLSSINFARASDFAGASTDLKAAGLEPPAARVTLHDAKASADRVLLIGKSKETDKYFAKDASRPSVFVIDKEIPEKVRRPLFDWRDKSVARLDRDAIDEMEIVRGSEKISAKKSGTDWALADGRKAKWDKISGMINTLEFERAKQIVDSPQALSNYGLDKPKLEVTFRQAGKEVLAVRLGADSKDPEGIYLKSSAGPAVYTVSKDVYDSFNVKVDDLIEPPPPPPETKK